MMLSLFSPLAKNGNLSFFTGITPYFAQELEMSLEIFGLTVGLFGFGFSFQLVYRIA